MSAIAARKARLALQAEAQESASSSSSDYAGPSSIPLAPKRKAAVGKGAAKVSRQKQRRGDPRYHHIGSSLSMGVAAGAPQLDLDEGDDDDDDDSSDESDDFSDVEKEEETEVTSSRSAILSSKPACSTFSPIMEGKRKNWHLAKSKKQASLDSDVDKSTSLIIGLTPNQTLLFAGKVQVKVLDGHCSISGALLTSQHLPVSVYAPQSAPLPLIQAGSGSPTCKAFHEYGLGDCLFSAVVQITRLHQASIDDICLACPLVRPGTFALPSSTVLPGFYLVLQPTRGLIASHLPPSWEQALRLTKQGPTTPLYLIKGPKRVGKSTFSRYLLNRLVSTGKTSIAYLETDLGQAEFGPPGVVALHLFGSLSASIEKSAELVIGPSWTSLRCPLRSHFLGDTTPRDDPSSYNNCLADLIQYYNGELKGKGIPLIVNTQGWVKGLGADLLAGLEQSLQPTHVFDMMQFDEDGDIQQTASTSAHPLLGTTVVRLEAAPLTLTRDRGLNAVEARTLNLVSYFYSTHLPGPLSDGHVRWDFSLSLVEKRPYIVDVRQGLQGGLFILAKGAQVDRNLQLMALNGSCVAIVSTSHQPPSDEAANLSVWKRALAREMPPLQSCTFLSLALVRSIDVDKGEIHLITPLSAHQLHSSHTPSNHLCLVKGAIEVPIWLSLNHALIEASQISTQPSSQLLEGVPLSEVPYLDFAPESNNGRDQIIGQERRKVRRNIQRRSQRGGPQE